MTIIATALKHMLAAGMSHEAIVQAVAEMEAKLPRDEQAERRRAKDRERKRLRNSAESAEFRDTLPPKEKSPTPPKEITPNPVPPSPPKGGSSPAGFEEFWSLYPNKVGKSDAVQKFGKALQRADLETILSGLRRYVAKTDDRPWCNPATWLHQSRWTDEPAQVPQQARASPQQPARRRTPADAAKDLLRSMQNADRPDRDSFPNQPLALGFSGRH